MLYSHTSSCCSQFIGEIPTTCSFQAERCSLFLVDRKQQELVAKVFDGNMLPDGTVEVGGDAEDAVGGDGDDGQGGDNDGDL